MVAAALFPSLIAVIVADPTATAVAPLELTVATCGLLVVQVITLPNSTLPLESLGVAVSGTEPPTATRADVGLTLSDATGTVVTVRVAVPLFPSEVAVIVAGPDARAVATPFASTVATLGALLVQMTARPVNGLPVASSGVATNCSVAPTKRLALAGLTATDATGLVPPGSAGLAQAAPP